MSNLANGAQPVATPADPDGSPPFGGAEGRGFAPPLPAPPAPTALEGRVVGLERNVELIVELLEKQTPPAKRQASKVTAKGREFLRTYTVPLCIGGAVVATCIGIITLSPRLSEEQVAQRASMVAVGEVGPYVDAQLAANRADATQVIVPDPFSYYGRELTEDSKTAIGYDATTGNKTLNPARALVVANQVKEALSQKSMTLDEMRLSSIGPTQLRVHNNPAEGYQLFAPPAVRAPDSMTVPSTATSAP